jgi:hypothetical protein
MGVSNCITRRSLQIAGAPETLKIGHIASGYSLHDKTEEHWNPGSKVH